MELGSCFYTKIKIQQIFSLFLSFLIFLQILYGPETQIYSQQEFSSSKLNAA